MKENLVYFLIVVVLLGAVGYWYYRGRGAAPEITPEGEMIVPTEEQVSPGEEEVAPVSDKDLIKQALAKKHGKSIDEVEVTISKIDFPHARGTVRFAGEVAGGWWLAYKEKGGFIIVADGNGAIPCETIAPYDFPKSIVPEC